MSKKDDQRNEVSFSPPDADDYKKRIDAAKGGHIPVGGTEMPRMPRLDQPPQQNRHQGVQNAAVMNPAEYNQALAQGNAIPGVGAAFVANQPRGFTPPSQQQSPNMEITSKDGNPVNPPRAEGGLRPETQEAIKAVAEANADPNNASVLSKDDEEYIGQLADKTNDILRNKERREYIEKQITDELSFDELLYNQEIRQRVPIRGKKFTPTFRTPSAAEDLFIKRLVSKEEGSPQYILDKYAALGLVCGLFAINEKPLPSHLDEQRNPTEKLFEEKFNMVMRYPLILVADLSANFIWFEARVQKLMSLETIRNF